MEGWRTVIAVLREKGLDSMLEHADRLESTSSGTDLMSQPMVSLAMNDVYLYSYTGARVELGIPLPPMER